jgi:hypothetical protein
MVDRPRLRKEDELARSRRPASTPDRRDGPRTPSVLDLQRSAGNQAVAQLLAAEADASPTVQRDETDTTSGVGTMSIPEWKLDVPIQSFQHGASRPNREKAAGGEVYITFDKKHLDARLMKAVTDGKQFEEITVQVGGRKITLRKVFLSSISMSGDFVSLSLSFGSIELPGEGGGSNEYQEGGGR